MAGVPLILQQDFYCGPTSLAMVMQWAGADVTQADIAALAFTPEARGTYLSDMIGAARRRGQLAVTFTSYDALMAELAAGHPVIVFQNLGLRALPRWHYAVVVGYDLEADTVTLHSGELDRVTMSLALFERTWARGDHWGLIVLPPDRLPVSAREVQVLEAGAALERVGQNRAAATLYRTGARRWPESWIWPYGEGNALYALGDKRGAERAFRRAVDLGPNVPEARNNLDEVRKALRAAG